MKYPDRVDLVNPGDDVADLDKKAVKYNGAIYISLRNDNLNNIPTDVTYWRKYSGVGSFSTIVSNTYISMNYIQTFIVSRFISGVYSFPFDSSDINVYVKLWSAY